MAIYYHDRSQSEGELGLIIRYLILLTLVLATSTNLHYRLCPQLKEEL